MWLAGDVRTGCTVASADPVNFDPWRGKVHVTFISGVTVRNQPSSGGPWIPRVTSSSHTCS